MDPQRWQNLALSHARCAQIFLFLHHTLLLPSILVPPVVSLFEPSSAKIIYCHRCLCCHCLSLALKLELRAYSHNKTAKEWLLPPANI